MCRNWHNGSTFKINITDTRILSTNSTRLKQNNILPGLLSEIEGLNTDQTYGLQTPRGQEVFFMKLHTNWLCLQPSGWSGFFLWWKRGPRVTHIYWVPKFRMHGTTRHSACVLVWCLGLRIIACTLWNRAFQTAVQDFHNNRIYRSSKAFIIKINITDSTAKIGLTLIKDVYAKKFRVQ